MLARKDNITEQEILKVLEESDANIMHTPMVLLSDTKKPIGISETRDLLINSKDYFISDKTVIKSNLDLEYIVKPKCF